MIQNHKSLVVWKESVTFAADIYRLSSTLPVEERYGLSVQMRNAAISIASNIAEGAARGSSKEFVRFLNIAAGSASELDTQMEILLRIGIIDNSKVKEMKNGLDSISRMIQGLIRSIR
ncbi:MAG: four helix bundle protein [bacterium]|nr:MAG: four helix bundle protein [bacterium]